MEERVGQGVAVTINVSMDTMLPSGHQSPLAWSITTVIMPWISTLLQLSVTWDCKLHHCSKNDIFTMVLQCLLNISITCQKKEQKIFLMQNHILIVTVVKIIPQILHGRDRATSRFIRNHSIGSCCAIPVFFETQKKSGNFWWDQMPRQAFCMRSQRF